MLEQTYQRAIRNLQLIPPINLLGNLVGAGVTFVWFAGVAPGVVTETAHIFWERIAMFSALLVVLLAVVIPVNLVWILRPLLRQLRRLRLNGRDGGTKTSMRTDVRMLIGGLLDLPVKLSCTTVAAWIGCALVLDVLPVLIPHHYSWPSHVTHKMVAWVLLVGAPTTVLVVYFVMAYLTHRREAAGRL